MSRILLLTFLLAVTSAVASESCDHRIIEIEAPRFPTSLHAQHTVIREGACSVDLTFDLDKSGNPENIRYSVKEDRCSPFERSSVVALRAGKFSAGPALSNCTYKFSYELE